MPTAQDRKKAAAHIRRLVAMVDDGRMEAPGWLVERMRGAIVALEQS